jgi:hypothetical protein
VDAGGHILLVVIIVGPVHGRHVEHKIADLTIEVALVDIPFIAITPGLVNIGVNESNALEIMSTLDNGLVIGISHELGVVVLYDWCTSGSQSIMPPFLIYAYMNSPDQVRSGWEVYNSTKGGCGATLVSATKLR